MLATLLALGLSGCSSETGDPSPARDTGGDAVDTRVDTQDGSTDTTDGDSDASGDSVDDTGDSPFVVVLEAEDGQAVGDLATQDGALPEPACADSWVEASGSTDNFVWDSSAPSLPDHRREFDVELPEDGTYHVFVRLSAPSEDADALYLGFGADDLRRVYPSETYAYDQSWVWVSSVDTDAARLEFDDLTAGQHTLVLGHGEAGVRVDRIVVAAEQDAEFERSCGDCTPQCSGRTCGDDGCGGTCGSCSDDQVCTSDGQCEDDSGPAYEDLLDHRVGFARNVTGGAGGEVCWVENLDDSGPGSLRSCAEADGPRWIRFNVSGEIATETPRIELTSDKTIDGRGQDIVISGSGLGLLDVENVIVHNVRISGATGPNRDALSIARGSRDIWIDHVTLDDFTDGLIDITLEATNVTVSWCHLSNHDKAMLIGADVANTGDTAIRVTLHHNYFEETNQRHPRLRYGRVHAYNNLLVRWGHYGMASSQNGELFAENNIYEADSDTRAAVPHAGSDPDQGYIRASGNLLLGGAEITEREPSTVFDPSAEYSYTAETADTALRTRIENGAGRQDQPSW